MGIAVSTIQSLIGQYPLGLMDAQVWYSDYPTSSDTFFGPAGYFSGGDLPFGIVYELHNIPADEGHNWTESIVYPRALGKIVNNAALHVGIGTALPVEEFLLDRPRGLLMFHEPATTSIVMEFRAGVTAKIWGVYLPIPFVTPTQMTWNPTTPAPTVNPATIDGTVFSGLTDTGAITLGRGTVGVRVDVTAVPPQVGVEAGAINHFWNVGWINWGDGSAYRAREWITGDVWESMPVQPGTARVLAYTLTPGVTATFTQLLDSSGEYL